MRILAVGAIVALLGTGCATVTRGTSQSWTVETDPVGAEVRLSSGETCKTPCTLKKKRKHAFTVDIAKEGYEAVTTDIVSSVSGAGATGMAGNVLVGGLIGIGIDAGTGAAKDLKPNPLVVKLIPTTTMAAPAPTAAETTVAAVAVESGSMATGDAAAAETAATAPSETVVAGEAASAATDVTAASGTATDDATAAEASASTASAAPVAGDAAPAESASDE